MEFHAGNAETSLGMRLSGLGDPGREWNYPGWESPPLKRLPREVSAFPAGDSIPGRGLPDRSNAYPERFMRSRLGIPFPAGISQTAQIQLGSSSDRILQSSPGIPCLQNA